MGTPVKGRRPLEQVAEEGGGEAGRPQSRCRSPSMEAWPATKYSVCQKRVKDEDVLFVREGLAVDPGGPAWSVYCLCDGHAGSLAAKYVRRHLWRELGQSLPKRVKLDCGGQDSPAFAAEVRSAVATAFVNLGKQFKNEACNEISGTTVTMALLCGSLLTVANVGDSDAVLDTGLETVLTTVNHKIETNETERERLKEGGVQLVPLSCILKGVVVPGDRGIGPLRCWPGGQSVARSIGDIQAGDHIISCPHIFQVVLPNAGARLTMASDSLWDYIQWDDAALVTRKAPAAHAADALISAAQARCDGSLPDDTSALVLDVRPAVRSGEFFKRADRSPKKSGGPRWGRALSSALGALVCGGARTAGRADGGISDGDRLRVVAEVDGLDLVKATAGDESSRLEGLTPKSTEQSAKKVAHRPPRATPRTPIKGSRGPGRRPPTNRSKSRSSGSSGSSGSVDLLIMYGRSARRSTSCPDMALPDDVRKGSGSGDLSMSVECCKPVGGSGAVRASDRSLRSIAMKASHGDPGAAMFMARPQRGLGARASGTKGRAGGHDADKQSVSAQLATILKRLSAELKAGRH